MNYFTGDISCRNVSTCHMTGTLVVLHKEAAILVPSTPWGYTVSPLKGGAVIKIGILMSSSLYAYTEASFHGYSQ